MGYYYTSEPETAVPANSCASPKTHVPGSPVKERGYRYYSADVGRWVNRDPIEERRCINLYCAMGGMILNFVDPVGLETYGGNVTDGTGCCCPDYIHGPDDLAVINNQAFGHSFGVYVKLTLQTSSKRQPCSLKWEEKTNDPYISGMTANEWSDMTDLIPNSPAITPLSELGSRLRILQMKWLDNCDPLDSRLTQKASVGIGVVLRHWTKL